MISVNLPETPQNVPDNLYQELFGIYEAIRKVASEIPTSIEISSLAEQIDTLNGLFLPGDKGDITLSVGGNLSIDADVISNFSRGVLIAGSAGDFRDAIGAAQNSPAIDGLNALGFPGIVGINNTGTLHNFLLEGTVNQIDILNPEANGVNPVFSIPADFRPPGTVRLLNGLVTAPVLKWASGLGFYYDAVSDANIGISDSVHRRFFFKMQAVNSGFLIGRTDQASAVFIDFNTSGLNLTRDVRLIASGGAAGADLGFLAMQAAAIRVPSGSAAIPGLGFNASTTMGFYRQASAAMGFATGALHSMLFETGGRLTLNHTAPIVTNFRLNIHATDGSIKSVRHATSSTAGHVISVGRTRSTTIGTYAASLLNGDSVAVYQAFGDDGTDIATLAGEIRINVSEVPITNRIPTQFSYWAGAPGADDTLAEIFRANGGRILGNVGGFAVPASITNPMFSRIGDEDTGMNLPGGNIIDFAVASTQRLQIAIGSMILGNGIATQQFILNGGAGTNREIRWWSAGILRAIMSVDSTAETGIGNAGSDWRLTLADDLGASTGAVLIFPRQTDSLVRILRPTLIIPAATVNMLGYDSSRLHIASQTTNFRTVRHLNNGTSPDTWSASKTRGVNYGNYVTTLLQNDQVHVRNVYGDDGTDINTLIAQERFSVIPSSIASPATNRLGGVYRLFLANGLVDDNQTEVLQIDARQMLVSVGTTLLPMIAQILDPDTGINIPGSNLLDIVAGATQIAQARTTGFEIFQGLFLSTRTVIASGAVLSPDWTIRGDCTAGAISMTLPAVATSAKRTVQFKKIDASANTLTIQASGAELIDGINTKVIATQYTSVTLHCNGTSWDIV